MSRSFELDDVLRLVTPQDLSLDPAGQRIAYVRRGADRLADRNVHSVWLIDGAGMQVQLTEGPDDRCPSWSPDGSRLAFLRAGTGIASAQLWLLDPDTGESSQLTQLPAGAGPAVWSPDGARIAFLAPALPSTEPATPEQDSAPVLARRMDYQSDGRPPVTQLRRQLYLLDLAGGEPRQLTGGDWDVIAYGWSPDSATIAFTANAQPDSDITWESSGYLIDVAKAGARPRPIGPAGGRLGQLCWYPDGRSLLVVGRRDIQVGLARLLAIRISDGQVEELGSAERSIAGIDAGDTSSAPRFIEDGSRIVYCVRDGGDIALCVLDLESGSQSRLTGAGTSVLGFSVSQGPVVAAILNTPELFGEIHTIDLRDGSHTARTSLQQESLGDIELFGKLKRSFSTVDGQQLDGWLLTDESISGPKPLLLEIHGGPHGWWGPAVDQVNLHHQLLAAQGWIVLTVNPRGSEGYGEQFLTAAIGRWGEADLGDVIEPVDELVAEGLADEGRLAVAGHSYGGYLACYLTAHDGRFAAAVISAPVSDLSSALGTSDLSQYLLLREFAAATPATLARLSPIGQVDRVQAATLLLHGSEDLRCPVGQSQQWFTALRRREVPVEFVRYPGVDHDLASSRPSHRLDIVARTVGWLVEHTATARVIDPVATETERWQRLLAQLIAKYQVPGAALGILQVTPTGPDRLSTVAAGVRDIETEVPVTPDTIFQLGSITKVWTAVLLLQLCDEGRLDLDDSLAKLLDDLVLSDEASAGQITPRQLLSHVSGIDGDLYFDTGRGDDCISRLVDLLRDVPPLFAPGESWSYGNTGFIMIAHLIERITGDSWDHALRSRLIEPLGLRSTVTLPEEILVLPAAVGHLSSPDGTHRRAPIWGLPRAMAPAGVINSSAGELLQFARMLISDGRLPDGRQLLSEAAVSAMRSEQARLPEQLSASESWGLGLTLLHGYDQPVIGHDGGMIGQTSFMRMIPNAGVAVVLLTNGGHASGLFDELFEAAGRRLAGLAVLAKTTPKDRPAESDVRQYLGSYRREGKLIEVSEADAGLRVHITSTVELIRRIGRAELEYELRPAGPGLFTALDEQGGEAGVVAFFPTPSGRMLMHQGFRATPRID